MKIKIRNERATFFFLIFFTILSLLITAKITNMDFISIPIIAEICLLLLFIFLSLLDILIGTTITIEDTYISIKQLFKYRRISYGEILSINIENYTRTRTKYATKTYRMKMIIRLANGHDIFLNDNASKMDPSLSGILTSDHLQIPDEEVNLYKAYMMIKPRVKGPVVSSY
jgi:hypothetical protein